MNPSKSSIQWGMWILGLLISFLSVAACSAADYVLVVDTSGSMTEPISRKNRAIRIQTVQQALANYISALPDDSRVTFISFNTGITSEREIVFRTRTDRDEAAAWAATLDKEAAKQGQTYLWSTLRRALQVASGYSQQRPDSTVMVRVLTDGQDTERRFTLEKVLNEFPSVDGKGIRANLVLLGDLEIPIRGPHPGFDVVQSPQWDLLTPPVILWAPQPIRVGEEISFFDNSKSVYKLYEWRVGDRLLGHDKVLRYRFERSGEYQVSLAAVGEGGARDMTRAQVKVLEPTTPEPLLTDFVFTPAQPEVNETVRFLGRTSRTAKSAEWFVGEKAFANGIDAEHSFTSSGTYEVRLVCTDVNGQKSEKTLLVTVREPSLTVSFKVPSEAFSGQVIQFVNETEGKVARFKWDFGDSDLSGERNPTKVYTNNGDDPMLVEVFLEAFTSSGKSFKSQSAEVRI